MSSYKSHSETPFHVVQLASKLAKRICQNKYTNHDGISSILILKSGSDSNETITAGEKAISKTNDSLETTVVGS